MNRSVQILGGLFLILNILSCKVTQFQKEIKALENLEIFKVSIDKTEIILNGTINSSALKEFKKLINANPAVNTLRIINCEGSINDNVNLKLAKFVHEKGLNTHLEENGLVASGGTDLFLAGKSRTRGEDTRFGVHSWSGENKKGTSVTAKDFPQNHKYHQPYIEYYMSVGFTQKQAENFYFFTINAAPANDIYWMTNEDIKKYNMTTEPIIMAKKIINTKNIYKELIGKWKLQTIAVNGNLATAKEAFGTSEVYQVYEIDSKITGIVGDHIDNGTWKLSNDKRKIVTKGTSGTVTFKIKYFNNKQMTLLLLEEGITLNYEKI